MRDRAADSRTPSPRRRQRTMTEKRLTFSQDVITQQKRQGEVPLTSRRASSAPSSRRTPTCARAACRSTARRRRRPARPRRARRGVALDAAHGRAGASSARRRRRRRRGDGRRRGRRGQRRRRRGHRRPRRASRKSVRPMPRAAPRPEGGAAAAAPQGGDRRHPQARRTPLSPGASTPEVPRYVTSYAETALAGELVVLRTGCRGSRSDRGDWARPRRRRRRRATSAR